MTDANATLTVLWPFCRQTDEDELLVRGERGMRPTQIHHGVKLQSHSQTAVSVRPHVGNAGTEQEGYRGKAPDLVIKGYLQSRVVNDELRLCAVVGPHVQGPANTFKGVKQVIQHVPRFNAGQLSDIPCTTNTQDEQVNLPFMVECVGGASPVSDATVNPNLLF